VIQLHHEGAKEHQVSQRKYSASREEASWTFALLGAFVVKLNHRKQ